MLSMRSGNRTAENIPGVHDHRCPPRLAVWVQAARPRTLIAAITPVVLASFIASGDDLFHAPTALAALLGALLIQVGTNLANDYFDYLKGADTADRVGPQRVTQAGLVHPDTMRVAMILSFGLAFLVGIYLVSHGGWPIVVVGLLSLLLGVIYTGGPFPLAYNGLGDVFAFLFFGPIAAATTYYVQALHWSDLSILMGCVAGFFSVAFLAINNLRDMEQDRQAGKHTLVALFGRKFGQWQYIFCIIAATGSPVLFPFVLPGHTYLLLTLFTLPMAIFAIRQTLTYREPLELIPVLGMTGKLEVLYTVLFAVGWFL